MCSSRVDGFWLIDGVETQVLLDSMYALPAWRARGVQQVLVTQATVEEAKPAELNPPPRELDEKARRA